MWRSGTLVEGTDTGRDSLGKQSRRKRIVQPFIIFYSLGRTPHWWVPQPRSPPVADPRGTVGVLCPCLPVAPRRGGVATPVQLVVARRLGWSCPRVRRAPACGRRHPKAWPGAAAGASPWRVAGGTGPRRTSSHQACGVSDRLPRPMPRASRRASLLPVVHAPHARPRLLTAPLSPATPHRRPPSAGHGRARRQTQAGGGTGLGGGWPAVARRRQSGAHGT